MIPPAELIPVAEDTGLIIEVGAYVLREACRQNRIWQQAEGDTVPVAVNLSAAQFVRRDLAALITSILEETGLEPACSSSRSPRACCCAMPRKRSRCSAACVSSAS